MKTIRHYALMKYAAFVLLAICFNAALAAAQDAGAVYRGSFHLPFEARWGTAVLPPGDYTLALNSTTVPSMVTVRGEKTAIMVQAQLMARHTGSDRSALVLVRRAKKGVVRSLYLAEMEIAFHYGLPKEERPVLAQGPQLIQRIPVTMTGR
jgi:hypothetical protein